MTAAGPVALALCALLGTGTVSAVAAPTDNPPATQGISADQEGESLLLKVEQQILSGRTVAPLEDNALATWEEVRKRAQEPTPAFTRAVEIFIRQSENHAEAERSAGRDMVAFDLQAFADMAQELLQRGAVHATPSDGQSAEKASGEKQSSEKQAAPAAVASVSPSAAPPVQSAAASVKMPANDTVQALAVPVTPPPAPATAPAPPLRQPSAAQERMAATLASRGDAMMAIKDISAARKLYEQAANMGSAAAAAELARTYDPGYLGKFDIIGMRPDLAQAANWYVRAAALGDRQAAQRMHELDAMLGSSPPAKATP